MWRHWVLKSKTRVPSTRIGFCLKKQLFRCGYGLRPHESNENVHRKRNFLKTRSRVKFFENAVFLFPCGRGKKRAFRKRWRISFGSRLPARKKMVGYGNFMFLLCIKRPGNMLGYRTTNRSKSTFSVSAILYSMVILEQKRISLTLLNWYSRLRHIQTARVNRKDKVAREIRIHTKQYLRF